MRSIFYPDSFHINSVKVLKQRGGSYRLRKQQEAYDGDM